MFWFDKNLTYTEKLTNKEIIDIAKITILGNERTALNVGWIISCSILPIIAFILCDFNFIVGGFVFLLSDIIWGNIYYYIAIIVPHMHILDGTLSMAKDRLQANIDNAENMKIKIKNIKNVDKLCKDDDDSIEIDSIKRQIEAMEVFLKHEGDWMENKLIPLKEEELKSLQKPVKSYTKKRDFFIDFEERLKAYIAIHKLDCLNTTLDSLRNLMKTLDCRPEGYEYVPTMFYIYIDELQKVLQKISTKEQEQISYHMKDLTNVANALSKNMDKMVFRIKNAETEEIDVGLAVLLKALDTEEDSANA